MALQFQCPKPKVEPSKEVQKNANALVKEQRDTRVTKATEQDTDNIVPSYSDKKISEMDIG